MPKKTRAVPKTKGPQTKKHTFEPDYAVPPGATLVETLQAKGMSQSELAIRTGLAEKTISQIVHGTAPITYETALKLESALGVPARFWNNLERNFREAGARAAESERLFEDLEWLREIPVRVLVERGFIVADKDKASLLKSVLAFFGVSDVAAWKRLWESPDAAFRRSRRRELPVPKAATWIRMGEVIAEGIQCPPHDAQTFRKALMRLRGFTVQPPSIWQEKIVAECANAGVAVVFLPEIPGAGVSGITKWLSKDKALLQLSLIYKNDASLWFTFFHEAGHVLLHGKKDVFIEGAEGREDEKEQEADHFARNFLIPRERAADLTRLRSRQAIRSFAKSIGIAPGIVVGRLQHDGLIFPSAYNDLKRKLTWRESNG